MATNLDELIAPAPNPNEMGGDMPQMPTTPPEGNPEMAGAAPQMASPEQVQELQALLGNVQNANAQLVTKQLVDRNEISLMRKQLLGSLFDMLKQAGVDPSNPESVRSFLQQLAEQDPDLLEIFTTAFHDLQTGPLQGMVPDQSQEQGSPEDTLGGGPMDRFRNLSRTEPAPDLGGEMGMMQQPPMA